MRNQALVIGGQSCHTRKRALLLLWLTHPPTLSSAESIACMGCPDASLSFGAIAVVSCAPTRVRHGARFRSITPASYAPYLQTTVAPVSRSRLLGRRLFDPLDIATPSVRPGRLLELGSASGSYLASMKALGWDVTGVEPDRASAARASAAIGRPVLCAGVEDVEFDPRSYDLICAWMTFEHLHDPVETFRRCHTWLKSGGWLAFSVPDCGSWQFNARFVASGSRCNCRPTCTISRPLRSRPFSAAVAYVNVQVPLAAHTLGCGVEPCIRDRVGVALAGYEAAAPRRVAARSCLVSCGREWRQRPCA